MRIDVIVPVLNEEKIIRKSIERILAALEACQVDYGIIVVDDGSSDHTWDLITQSAQSDRRVKGLRLSRNFGHDAALFAGFKMSDADATITIDCDGQHPFELLPVFIENWLAGGVEIVNGVKSTRGRELIVHSIGAKMFGKVLSRVMKLDLENATEFKLVSRKARESLLQCGDYHYFYRALAPWIGYKQATVVFDVAEGMREGRHWNVYSLLQFALSGLVMFSDAPLKLILFLGLSTLGICSLLFVKLLITYFSSGVEVGYSTLLTLMLLNIGLLMTGLGVIGIYLQTTLNQTKNRPRAIVDEVTPGLPAREIHHRHL